MKCAKGAVPRMRGVAWAVGAVLALAGAAPAQEKPVMTYADALAAKLAGPANGGLRGVPANDQCSGAVTVALSPGGTATANGDMTNATDDPGLPLCSISSTAGTGTKGIWYHVQGTGNQITVETCNGASFDTALRVYCGQSCDTLTCLGGNDDTCNLQSRVTFCSQQNSSYLVLVSRYNVGDAGPVTVTFRDSGSVCTPTITCAPIIPRGACCVAGQCSVRSQADCTAAGGTYNGDNSSCADTGTALGNVGIPDNNANGASLSLTIPASITQTVNNLRVGVLVTHTWQGDLTITLSNGSQTATLVNRPGVPVLSIVGFDNDNYGNGGNAGNPSDADYIVFDDAASQMYQDPPLTEGTPNVTGSWLPETPLNVFNGQPLAGTWTLSVVDQAGLDTGAIRAFKLFTATALPGPCSQSSDACATTNATLDCYNPAGASGTRGGSDGVLDSCQCIGDWNRSGGIPGSADITAYLSAWFADRAASPALTNANVTCSGATASADITRFLSAWFAGRTDPASRRCQ